MDNGMIRKYAKAKIYADPRGILRTGTGDHPAGYADGGSCQLIKEEHGYIPK